MAVYKQLYRNIVFNKDQPFRKAMLKTTLTSLKIIYETQDNFNFDCSNS
jgi:hypothetical protein